MQHVVRDLVKALKEYGRDSLYFQGLLNAQVARIVAVPFDLKHLFKCLHSKTAYVRWKASWKELLRDALPSLLEDPATAADLNADEVILKHLLGEGEWATAAKQAAKIPRPILEKITKLAEKVFLEMKLTGPTQYYLDIFQGPSEPYHLFIERLTAAVE